MTDVTVEARSLVKRFGIVRAVDGVSFQVRRGEIFGFLGANGAGKTTTLRMLCGLVTPTSGQALIDGFDVFRQPLEAKARLGYL
ncbi:MAG TPA: ATP-binding cassette domain-containing protein, partial [Candidatus Dormibacteraeota bacterium]|nr:ATP-binding cassette domain-containing protein [Candidatus Dormibacteraeota bacterium]